MKILQTVSLLLLLTVGKTYSQTTLKEESHIISSGHASITINAKRNGSALEVWVQNINNTKTYKISFTANIKLRGDKGEFVKSIKYSGKIAPNKKDFTMPTYIGYANAITSTSYNTLVGGVLEDFNWSEVPQATSSTNVGQPSTAIASPAIKNTNAEQTVSKPNQTSTTTTETTANAPVDTRSAQEMERQKKQAELDKTLQAIEQNQKKIAEDQRKTGQVVDAIGGSVTDFLAAERQRKAEAEEKRWVSQQQRSAKAKSLWDTYHEDALKGDEFAIEQVYKAYRLWDNYKEADKFINDMFNRYRSKFATKIKMEREISIMNSEIYEQKKNIRRSWFHPLLGAGLAYGGYKLGESIDADASLGDSTPGVWVQTAGILAGVYFVGSGLVNFARSFGTGKNSDNYKDSQKRYESLKQLTVSVTPSYNPFTKAPMMGMRINF